MRKYFYHSLAVIFVLAGFSAVAQPTFSTLSVASNNASATVVFSAPVGANAGVNQNLAGTDFTVSVSASTNGGTVAAGAVVVAVTHTAPGNTATLTFTIAGIKDGSEILTVGPASATSIYSAGGAMSAAATITDNLNDGIIPTVGITRANASPTNATSLNFTVQFSEDVTGVDAADFALTGVGVTGTINPSVVTVDPNTYTVNVTSVSGTGTLRLDGVASASISDLNGNAISSTAYTSGEVYTVDTQVPTATIVRLTPTAATTKDNPVVFRVTFSETVSNVDIADFVKSGTATGAVTGFTANSGTQYDLQLSATGNGNLNLDFAGGQNITDGVNAFNPGTGITLEEEYTIDNTAPASFTVGTAVANTGGTVTAGYYNSSNTSGIKVPVVINDDASLIGGKIQIQVKLSAEADAAYITLINNVNIPAKNVTQDVSIDHATFTANAKYANGNDLTFRAIITDLAANTATSSNVTTLSIDTSTPSVPAALDLATADDTGTNTGDNKTKNATGLTISGTGDIGSTIQLYDNVTPVGSTTVVDGSGNWTIDLALAEGTHPINAKASDAAGNVSAATGNLSIIVDQTIATPTITFSGTDTGLSAADNITNDATPTFAGAATTGDIITLTSSVDGAVGSTTAAAGAYTVSALTAKTGTITTTTGLTAVVGVGTSFTTELTVGRSLYNAAGTTFIGVIGSITNNTNLVLVRAASATVVSSAFSQGASDNSNHSYTVTATDDVGNVANSAPYVLNIDLTPPSVTSSVPFQTPIKDAVPRTGTISVANGGTTVTGTGTAFLTELYVGANIRLGTGTTNLCTCTVTAIASNTSLTLSSGADALQTNVSFYIRPYFTVTFNEVVQSSTVTTADFAATVTSSATAGIQQVNVIPSGTSGTTYHVQLNTIAGDGTVRIDKNSDSYTDIAGNASTTTYTGGSTMTVDHTGPTLTITQPATGSYVNTAKVTYTIGETLGSGSITWTKTAGTGGGTVSATLTGAELTSGQTNYLPANGPTLLNGLTYTVTITGTDVLGNSTTSTGRTGVIFDTSAPTVKNPTITDIDASAGRSITNYYNLSNSGAVIEVDLPNDNSIVGGTIQLQASINGGTNWFDIGSAATIVNDNTTQNVSVTHAQLVSLGMVEGTTVTFRAKITDQAGNGPSTSVAGLKSLTADFTRPTISGAVKLYNNKGTGGSDGAHEVMLLQISENIYGPTGTAKAHNDLMGSSTTYGNSGWSVDTNPTDEVRWFNDGTTSTIDNTITYTRILYVESADDASNWAATTNLRYKQYGTASSSAGMFDIAGNEMSDIIQIVSSGDVLKPVVSPDVMTLYPRGTNPEKIIFTLDEALNIPSGNAVVGFTVNGVAASGTYFEDAVNGIYRVTLESAVTGMWTSGAQVSYDDGSVGSNAIDLATPGNELADITNHAVVIETTPPSIVSVSMTPTAMKVGSGKTITITTTDDDGDVTSLSGGGNNVNGFTLGSFSTTNTTTKTATFTVTEGGTNRASGDDLPLSITLVDGQGNVSTTFTTPISQLGDPIDANSPTIVAITNDTDPIYESDLVQIVKVQYSETMNTGVNPTITLTGSGGTMSGPTATGWSTTSVTNDTYSATYTHSGIAHNASGVTTSVAVGAAQDAATNTNLGSATSSGFKIDTQKPVVTTLAVSPNPINIDNNTLTITVTYNEDMETTIAPTISVTPLTALANFSQTGGAWDGTKRIYTFTYVHDLTPEHIPSMGITINSAVDDASPSTAIGNVQTTGVSTTIEVDTEAPYLVSFDRLSPVGQYTNGNQVTYRATFNENVKNLDFFDFNYQMTGTGSFGFNSFTAVDGPNGKIYDISLFVSGDGNLSVELFGSSDVIDERSNLQTTPFTSQTYTVDHTAPKVTDVVITDVPNSWSPYFNGITPVGGQLHFNVNFDEAISALDIGDFYVYFDGTLSYSATSVVPGTGNSWDVTFSGLTGVGPLYLYFYNNTTVKDLAGNTVGTPANFNYFFPVHQNYWYTVVYPAPTATPTNIQFTKTTTSFNVTFDDAITPVQQANGYLLRLKEASVTAFTDVTPVDGKNYLDTDMTDGMGAVYVNYTFNAGTDITTYLSSTNFTLKSGVEYDVEIYPVTFSDDYLMYETPVGTYEAYDYRTTPLTGSVTLNAAAEATFTNMGGAPSTINPKIDDIANIDLANPNFTFRINDDGALLTADNAPFKFSQIDIRQAASNGVANWTEVLEGAVLIDENNVQMLGTINPTTISFPLGVNDHDASGDFGYISDDGTKTYKLYVWFKDALSASWPQNIDGTLLQFRVEQLSFGTAGAYYDNTLGTGAESETSSQISTTHVDNAKITGISNNIVNVQAQKLLFTRQPPTDIGVASVFPVAIAPQVTAFDENDNTDKGFAGTLSVSNSLGSGTQVYTTPVASNGVFTIQNFYFTTQGSRTMSVTATGLLSPATGDTSDPVNAVISNKTVITATASPIRPAELSSLNTAITGAIAPQTSAIVSFDFKISDDVGANSVTYADNDGLPTRINALKISQHSNTDATVNQWDKIIAAARLWDGGTNYVDITTGPSITANSLEFSVPSGSLGYISDGNSKTYYLLIAFKTNIDSLIRDDIDGGDFVFEIKQGGGVDNNIAVDAGDISSTLEESVTNNLNSGNNNNVMDVDAKKIVFAMPPAAAQSYDASLLRNSVEVDPYDVILGKAKDWNGNLDQDWNTAATIATQTPGTYPVANATVTVTNGILETLSTLQVTSAGGGVNGGTTRLVFASSGLQNGISQLMTFTYSGASDVVHNGAFAYTPNIAYATAANQMTNLDNTNLGTAIEGFIIRDGGLAANDADGSPTNVKRVVFEITNYEAIRQLALYNADNTIIQSTSPAGDAEISVGTQFVTFDNLTGFFAPDNGTKTFQLRASFKGNGVVDNSVIHVRLHEIEAAGVSSAFALLNPVAVEGDENGVSTDNALNENKIEVTATSLDFTSISDYLTANSLTEFQASINTPFPSPIFVEARDVFENRDTDFTGTITALTVADPDVTYDPTPANVPSGAFALGTKTFPANFQYITGNDEFGTLTMTAGGVSGTSDPIRVLSAFDSDLITTNVNVANIPYVNYRASNIDVTTWNGTDWNGFVAYGITLRDGGLTTNISGNDQDGAYTEIDDLTIGVSNPQSIKRIGLFVYDQATDAITEIAEQDGIFTPTTSWGEITFSNIGFKAADDTDSTLYVVVTFNESASTVTDNAPIQFAVTNVTNGGGSKFRGTVGDPTYPTGNPGDPTLYIGGIAATTPSTAPGGTNAGAIGLIKNIEVVASKIDFIVQPPATAGINEPVPQTYPTGKVTVQARDQFNILDLDHNATANFAAPAGMNIGSLVFQNGVLGLDNIQYTGVGNGTIAVQSVNQNSQVITSIVNQPGAVPPNVAIASTHVDVIHVYGELATGGLEQSTSLSEFDKAIFGATFKKDYSISTQPILKKFTISFSNTVKNAFYNFRVYESADATFSSNDINVTNYGATVTLATDFQSLEVDLTPIAGGGRSLATANFTYFLVVDIYSTANATLPKVRPFIKDDGFGSPTANNVQTSVGSAVMDLQGVEYSFNSTVPPVLTATYPNVGQLNVDITQDIVGMLFNVPVWTMDGTVKLYDNTDPNNPVFKADLVALNGIYNPALTDAQNKANVSNYIKFAIPPGVLVQDHVYYITVPAATDAKTSGIMDVTFNKYGGISYSGTFYFKTTNGLAPKLLTSPVAQEDPILFTDPNIFTGAVLRGSFDQPGSAYYMVVEAGSSRPTINQIKNPLSTYPDITLGQIGTRAMADTINITQINPLSQFGIISNLQPATAYEVYVYGEAYSEKDSVKIPIHHFPTDNPYQGSAQAYAVGTATPTFSFTTPAAPSGPAAMAVNKPIIKMCGNSAQQMSLPIIISEGDVDDFYAGVTNPIQSFNILLPTGFEFASSKGSVILSGSDFVSGSGKITFINKVVAKVLFKSSGNSTYDFIAITGLEIIGEAGASGAITRLGGTAFTTGIADEETLAFLETYNAAAINFTNSYSKNEFPTWHQDHNGNNINYKTVTTIPDDFNETNGGTVELIPIQIANDYGPYTFSGVGVNLNELNLAAVTLGVAFNITMTHTDNNGCVGEKVVQFEVYDHETGLNALENTYCAENENFPNPSTAVVIDEVLSDFRADYLMTTFKAAIPDDVDGKQIMSGPDWKALISAWPVATPLDNPDYNDYAMNRQVLINAHTLNPNIVNVYTIEDNVKGDVGPDTTAQGQVFYKGGSLGIVEFTSELQSTQNSDVQVPIRKRVEYFIPAIPLVEVANPSDIDSTNMAALLPIFCKNGGTINITGYPLAQATISTGTFAITDVTTGAPLGTVGGGFVDNSNGTATIDPTKIHNNYNKIRITYTYQLIGSPCVSTATLDIRVTPNPVAAFAVDLTKPQCENVDVQFIDQSTIEMNNVYSIATYIWNFADPNTGATGNASDLPNPTHKYTSSGPYPNVSLIVKSNFQCPSIIPALHTVNIGGDVLPAFTFTGVERDISFNAGGSSTTDDVLSTFTWDFGDGATSTGIVTSHAYATPGIRTTTLIVESQKHCKDTIPHTVVALPTAPDVTPSASFFENFETNANWQAVSLDDSDTTGVSWIYTSGHWRTGGTQGKYLGGERSALYSAVFDLTALKRPIITFFDSLSLHGGDGVVVEYSTDNRNVIDPAKDWIRIGNNETGLDWYNNTDALSSSPGNHETGDHGFTFSGKGENDPAEWRESKHSLQLINPADRGRVVFRFALATDRSAAAIDRFGFALDSLRIGDGTRVVLVENFSNTSVNDAEVTNENEFFRVFPNVATWPTPSGDDEDYLGFELVKIDYHVPFQKSGAINSSDKMDPFNEVNPTDPGARALYYNLSTVPHTRIDGWVPPTDEGPFTQWGVTQYDREVLNLSEAQITATAESDNGEITVNVSFSANDDILQPTILHVAVIEETIDVTANSLSGRILSNESKFKYVLKKLLPSASGTKYTKLDSAELVTETFTYANPILFSPSDDLAVVVFLQDEATKKVYQSYIIRDITDPGSLTAVDAERIIGIYPNPADKEIMVELAVPVKERTPLRMYDQMGKMVRELWLEKGETTKTLVTQDYAAGMYLVQVQTPVGLVRKKVIVLHEQ
jgi:hypothetical protein